MNSLQLGVCITPEDGYSGEALLPLQLQYPWGSMELRIFSSDPFPCVGTFSNYFWSCKSSSSHCYLVYFTPTSSLWIQSDLTQTNDPKVCIYSPLFILSLRLVLYTLLLVCHLDCFLFQNFLKGFKILIYTELRSEIIN